MLSTFDKGHGRCAARKHAAAGLAMSLDWKKIFWQNGHINARNPCLRWKDQIAEILLSIGVENFEDAWKNMLRQTEIR